MTQSDSNIIDLGPEGSENEVNTSCVRCKSMAELMCERCGDRYCSDACQAGDWIRHKKICFPLLDVPGFFANSVNSNGLKDTQVDVGEWMENDEILLLTPRELRAKSIPSGTNVFITAIANNRTVFVRPSCASADKHLCDLFDDLDDYGANEFQSLDQLPGCGEIYLAKVTNEYFRVFVLTATDRNYKMEVFFIDFGHTDTVWLNQLSELSDELKCCEILLNKIRLAGVPEIQFSSKPLRFLNQLYDDEVELILMCSDEKMPYHSTPKMCQLQFIGEELTVNRKLIELNSHIVSQDLAKCTKHSFTMSLPIFTYDIPYVWRDGSNVEMHILQNSKINSFGYVTCVRLDQKTIFDQNMASVKEYGEHLTGMAMAKKTPYCPKLHEVCLIEHANICKQKKWYRAFCADPTFNGLPDEALMAFLDYDNILEIPHLHIWKLPSFLAFPVLSSNCFVHEYEQYRHILENRPNLKKEFPFHQSTTFDTVKRLPTSTNSALVSYKKIHKIFGDL